MLSKRILSSITTIALCASFIIPTQVFAAASFTGGSNVSGGLNVQVSITDLQVTGVGAGDTVPVFLYVPAGSLSMTTTTGLTFTGASSGQRLYFSGTLTDVNAALATLKYTHSSAGTFTLEASIIEAGQIYNPTNQHIYEVVNNGSTITGGAARTAALARTVNGVSGYLANITSSDENSFVAARISQDGWFGASDSGTEGTWKWLDGPESGTTFWIGTASGSAQDGAYENWATGEPNQSGDEDCSQFYANGSGWNDLSCSGAISTYVVEYGAPGNLPTVAGDTLDITLSSDSTPPTITNVTSDKADGSYKAGEVIDIDVTFSEAVTSTGNVTVTLETGATDRTCTFTVSNSTTGTCNYTVQAGDTSSDLTVSSISGTIADGASNAMTNFVPATNLAANKAIIIDTTAPIQSAVTVTPDKITATVTLTTDEPATSSISFGTTTSYGTTTAIRESVGTSHSGSISGLSNCGVRYHYQITTTDVAGNVSTSEDATFVTHCGSTRQSGYSPSLPLPEEEKPTEETSKKNTPTPETKVTETKTETEAPKTEEKAPELSPEKEEKITLNAAVESTCEANTYLTKYIKFGADNNIDDVMLLQKFLNTYENAGLAVTGFYSRDDFDAVVRWQEKYADDVLKPW